jgi:aminoglycoside 3-N-acetyltransferase
LTGGPVFESLLADLRGLGVQPGQDLLVHCSLRSIGLAEGGAEVVLEALREVAGEAATIVVPAYTTGNSGSSTVFRGATQGFSRTRIDLYLAGMPGFDPATTPSEGVGALAEHVRTRPLAARSAHPQTSFAALGAGAADCTRGHRMDCHLGNFSPLGWLYQRQAAVLLLGVGYAACSAFHLAEYRLPGERPRRAYHCFTVAGGERQSREFWDVDLDDSDFAALGRRMDGEPFVRRGRIGAAECRLVPIQRAVDFAIEDPGFQSRRMAFPARLASPPGGRDNRTALAPHGGTDIAASYFFLSYARLPPLPPVLGADLTDPPDEGVREFFRDLSAQVRVRAAAGSGCRPGFLDVEVASGPHWESGLADELNAAAVFVPLLSPDYYRRSWPRTEWATFGQRMRDAGVPEPGRRFMPVLWVPLPGGEQAPGLAEALSLADGAARTPYADHGLRALLRLPAYRGYYHEIVGDLAGRIVTMAEQAPLRSSRVQLHKFATPFSQGTGGKTFVIMVTGRYPSHGGVLPADYARHAAERLGFTVRVTEFTQSGDQLGRAPGVLLIDPGSLAGSQGHRDFDATIAELPPWVLPVIVGDRSARQPPGEIRDFLEKSYKSYRRKPEMVRRGLQGVSLLEFVTLMPFLVTHAEREYLRHGPIKRSAPRDAFRPRLADSSKPADSPLKENPHV